MRGPRSVPLLLLATLLLAGCFNDMADQPKYEPDEPNGLFPDGTTAQPVPEGTVDRAALAREAAAAVPPPVTGDLLARGQERYRIFCTPCHGLAGDGEGIVPQRGFPHPPSYHTERLRRAPAAHFFDVITEGYGAMYAYNDRVPPADRWAIIAYIRALQLSQMDEATRAPGQGPAAGGGWP